MPDFQPRPYSIRMFMPDGNPDSVRIVEKSNWTGQGFVFNRTNFKTASERAEMDKTGVYILVGSSDESSLPIIYIGEGDQIRGRLNSHNANRDFWDWAVFFISKDDSLNKAHVKYIESRLITLAKEAKRCKLENSALPQPVNLSESEKADMESFILDMLSIYPLIGIDVFEKAEINSASVKIFLYLKAKGAEAKGYEAPRGFVVCKGSNAIKKEVPSTSEMISKLRKDLLEQGILIDNGKFYKFTEDRISNSPSQAGCVIKTGHTNGRTMWKTKDGVMLKDLQAKNL